MAESKRDERTKPEPGVPSDEEKSPAPQYEPPEVVTYRRGDLLEGLGAGAGLLVQWSGGPVLKRRPRLVEGAKHLHQEGLHLLIYPRRPRWAVLNGTGYRVARLCDGRRSRREIAARISEQYDRSPNGVHDDVRSCLKQLEQAGLLAAGEGEASLPAYPCPTLKGLRLHLKWEFEDRPLAGYLDVRQATWVSGFITLIRLA